MAEHRPIEAIFDLARWAPSGDNTQPWRFQIVDGSNAVVHGFDTRDHCVYDLDGHPSQVSIGALLETIAIAATVHRMRTEVIRRDTPDNQPAFDLHFTADAAVQPDPLAAQITARSVQRRSMRRRRLTQGQKAALEAAVAPSHGIVWLEGARNKLSAASLMFANAKLRLTMPEAYLVHREIIEWGARYSEDRVPEQALGVDPLTAKLMRWVMADWRRVTFFNRFLAGTLAPRIQMDFLPSIFCAGHFVITAHAPPRSIDDYIAAGRSMQRFWLTLTGLGLAMQPEMTPLIFGRYVREGRQFSSAAGMQEQAQDLSRGLARLLSPRDSALAMFMGRIGAARPVVARSTRRPLSDLMT
jgi:nitroreductase